MSRDGDGSLVRGAAGRRETPHGCSRAGKQSPVRKFRTEGGRVRILEGIGGRGGVGARSEPAHSDALDLFLRRGREPTPLLGETVSQSDGRLSLRRPVFTVT